MERIRSTTALAILAGVVSFALLLPLAHAKRMGEGKSVGKQSQNVTQKQAPAQASTQQAKPASPAATPPAAAPAPQPNRWLGPLAGLAAGVGIAALLSHFGMGAALGEAMGSMLIIALLAFAAFFIWRMLRSKGQQPALAGAGAQGQDHIMQNTSLPDTGAIPNASAGSNAIAAPAPAAGGSASGSWVIPEGFDTGDFLHIAKMYFVRMQAAWDAGDQNDIRDFTTNEMFAEIKLDLVARGTQENKTDVVTIDAELLGVEVLGDKTMASVRFKGMIREGANAAAEPFTEVWNLMKPALAKASWVLAGIQQEGESPTKH